MFISGHDHSIASAIRVVARATPAVAGSFRGVANGDFAIVACNVFISRYSGFIAGL